MRTIDGEAVITAQHTLVVPVPPELTPSSYRVVVVIDTPSVDADVLDEETTTTDAWTALDQLGQELARDWPVGTTSANVLSALRDER